VGQASNKSNRRRPRWRAALLLVLPFLFGCSGLVSQAAKPLVDSLGRAINKQNDPQTVREGAPAYLLLIDGMVEQSPDDPDTLLAAASLYSAYVSAFVIDQQPERAQRLALKARAYAFRAAAIRKPRFDLLRDKPFAEFEAVRGDFQKGDEELLYLLISAWAAVIQTSRDDWDAIADIAKIELLTARLMELDERYYYGAPHLAMGLLQTVLPGELGGRPEEARRHFERAIEIAEGKFLPAYVLYAEHYAKPAFNRELYVKLLQKVTDTPADAVPELTLVNTLARERAQAMLAEADEFFDLGGTEE
jgi:hypothetical protein